MDADISGSDDVKEMLEMFIKEQDFVGTSPMPVKANDVWKSYDSLRMDDWPKEDEVDQFAQKLLNYYFTQGSVSRTTFTVSRQEGEDSSKPKDVSCTPDFVVTGCGASSRVYFVVVENKRDITDPDKLNAQMTGEAIFVALKNAKIEEGVGLNTVDDGKEFSLYVMTIEYIFVRFYTFTMTGKFLKAFYKGQAEELLNMDAIKIAKDPLRRYNMGDPADRKMVFEILASLKGLIVDINKKLRRTY